MQLISQEYVTGIKEGRQFLRENPDMSREEIKRHIETLKSCLKMGFSNSINEVMKGERDFFINQLDKE